MKIFLILLALLTKKVTASYGEKLKPFQDVSGTVCIVTFTSCLSLCLELSAVDDVDVVVVGDGRDVCFATMGLGKVHLDPKMFCSMWVPLGKGPFEHSLKGAACNTISPRGVPVLSCMCAKTNLWRRSTEPPLSEQSFNKVASFLWTISRSTAIIIAMHAEDVPPCISSLLLSRLCSR